MASTILLIDDDDDLRHAVTLVLSTEGHTVLTAPNGAVALEVLRGAAVLPLVILLDLRMPVMNGWQFRETQLLDPRIAGIPVVVFTADRLAASGIAGASCFLAKPLELNELVTTVARFAAGVR